MARRLGCWRRLRKGMVALLAAACLFFPAMHANASVILSFSDIAMGSVMPGGPTLYASGSVTLPIEGTILSNLTADFLTPSAVDFTISGEDGGTLVTFADPSYFMYEDAWYNGHYYAYVYTSMPNGSLDAIWDDLGISDIDGIATMDFTNLDFRTGFSTLNSDQVGRILMTTDMSVPEPATSTLTLSALGLLALSTRSRRSSRRGQKVVT